MEKIKEKEEKPQFNQHLWSKKLLVITVAVLVVALGGSGFYANKIYKAKKLKQQQAEEQAKIEKEKAEEAARLAKEQEEAKKKEDETAALKKEVADIDTSEIKAAVADLKSAMGAFTK